MLVPMAEESYRNGLTAWTEERHREALAFFEAALELERRYGEPPPQARYLSHYGLCLALMNQNLYEGVKYCKKAVTLQQFDADLRWNLARALLKAGRRRGAHEELLHGLKLQPDHSGIRRELKLMGLRKKPALAFLSRQHPLNVYLGKKRKAKK